MSKANMSKKYSFLILSLIFLFAILPLVASAPPVTTNQQFTTGYQLKYPSDQVLKQSMPYEFEVHVFNISDGYPITSGISCYFHLYNSTGKHQLELTDATTSHNFDYSFDVGAGNFSKVGDYYYIIQCNSSSLGGFVEVPFQVTPNGLELTEGRAMVDLGLLFMLVIFLIGCVVLSMENDHLLAKVGFLGSGYLLLIAITFISWNMASDFLLSAPFIAEMFRILFFVMIAGLFPLIIGGFAWYVIMLFKIKEIKRLMGKGFSEDEARRRTR
jgi:hypothetical protein